MSAKVTLESETPNTYRERCEKAGRSLEIARMTLKHERRLLRMRKQGVVIK